MPVHRVSTQSQFESALKMAKGGDTILLAPGNYGKLEISAGKKGFAHTQFSSKVTIASADATRPAVVNDLTLRDASNIELKGIKFDWTPAKTSVGPIWVENASKITFNDVTVEGHIVGKFGQGVGVRVKNSTEIAIVESTVRDLRNGFNFSNVENVKILNNDFRGISNDGMIVGGLTDAVISGNDFRDYRSDPNIKHKDSIQFNTSEDIAPSRDVLILNNVIINPEQSHAIFFGNGLASGGDRSAYWRNIIIEDNYISSAQKHGITIEHGFGVVIRNNTIVQNTDLYKAGLQINTPLINVSKSSLNVEISGNKVASVPDAANATWKVVGNSTGTKKLLHWDSTIEPAKPGPVAPPKVDSPAPSPSAPQHVKVGSVVEVGGSEEFRFNGKIAAAKIAASVGGVDFDDGDVIIFRSFEAGTFAGKKGGNQLITFDDGASVKIDSALDLEELAASSKLVSMSASSTGALAVKIAQEKGWAELWFDGLADDYRSAAHPELF